MQLSNEFPAQFPLRPPISGEWSTLDRADAGLIVTRLSEAGFLSGRAVAVDAIRLLPLDFFPGWLLCDVAIQPKPSSETDSDAAPSSGSSPLLRNGIHSLLYGPDGFTALDGTSVPIHEHNMRHGVELSEDYQRQAYFRFFCFFVRGEEGPFEIVENCSGLVFAEAAGSPAIKPPESLPIANDSTIAGAFRAHVLYGNNLFRVQFNLQKTGMVLMEDDEQIVEGVRRDPPIGFEGTMRFSSKSPEEAKE